MFYHQVVASKPRMMPKEGDGKKIKFQLPDFGLKDTLMALLVGAAVYMAFGQLEQSTRILQAVLCGLVAAVVLRRMNERQNGETSGKKANSVSADKNQALQLLESSGLKHGTIALITDHVPVIAIATQKHIFAKTISNIREVKARGAYVVLLVTEDTAVDEGITDVIIRIPKEDDKFTVFPIAVVLQLIAYYASVQKGLDVDQPRNLAKSVTVE